MTGEYLKIRTDACRKDTKMNTLYDIEKELGVNLLSSPIAYEDEENLYTYNPHISDDEEMYGVMIMNDFYSVGDLKDVKSKTYANWSDANDIYYNSGDNYKSPIFAQITIRTDKNASAAYDNHELNYFGLDWNLDESNEYSNIETYEIKNLGVKAVMYTAESDGIVSWENLSGDEVESITTTMFVYEGIEYVYAGDVSHDTMKAFLDTLE